MALLLEDRSPTIPVLQQDLLQNRQAQDSGLGVAVRHEARALAASQTRQEAQQEEHLGCQALPQNLGFFGCAGQRVMAVAAVESSAWRLGSQARLSKPLRFSCPHVWHAAAEPRSVELQCFFAWLGTLWKIHRLMINLVWAAHSSMLPSTTAAG